MGEDVRSAITAIADSRTESFVAASLVRQGWDVIFRALSYPDLINYLSHGDFSDIPVFLSPDLKGIAQQSERAIVREILIKERPMSDFEVAELLREREVPATYTPSPLPPHVKVIGVASIGRGVGTSTIALNLAQELLLHGAKTLLIDCHLRNPYLSSHTGLFGLTRGIVIAPFQLPLLEVASPRRALEERIFEDGDFEYLILDCGEIYQPSQMVHGRRNEDAAFEWLSLYGRELIILREESEMREQNNQMLLQEIERLAIKPRISHIINKCDPAQKKKFQATTGISRSHISETVNLFSLDTRSLSAMGRERSTLAHVAPKSQLRHDLLAFAAARNWWRD